jgi:hypothetical protein
MVHATPTRWSSEDRTRLIKAPNLKELISVPLFALTAAVLLTPTPQTLPLVYSISSRNVAAKP